MAVATCSTLAPILYQATIVLLRIYASFLSAQLVLIWNVAKWIPTVCSTLWTVAICLWEGFLLPFACRMMSYLWTCMLCTYSNIVSGAISYISHDAMTKRELWGLSLCEWKLYLSIGFVGGTIWYTLTAVFEHFDEFDKGMARADVHHRAFHHRAIQRWARDTGHSASDNVGGMVPTSGVYNYSRAYELNHRANGKTANNEE
jgi:hypothetical protein